MCMLFGGRHFHLLIFRSASGFRPSRHDRYCRLPLFVARVACACDDYTSLPPCVLMPQVLLGARHLLQMQLYILLEDNLV